MASHALTRKRSLTLAIIAAVAVVATVVLGVWRPWTPPAASTPSAAGEGSILPAALVLPEHPRVLVFGDSWTYGSAATPPTGGYAYRLAELIDGETIVRGVRGSGYQRPGGDGPEFRPRIMALDASIRPDLIVIQGSINDRRQKASEYRDAVNAAWDALVRKFPATPIVVFGPAPHELPVDAATARIDRDLSALAAERGWWYISPVKDRWITEQNYLDVIDVGPGHKHPSDAGHEYLATKLADALATFSTAPVTAAEGTQQQPAE